MKRPPWKLALLAFGIVLGAGLVVGLVAIAVNPGGDMEARGEAFGQGLGTLAAIVAVVVLLVALARQGRERAAGGAPAEASTGEPILAEAGGGLFHGRLRMVPARFELTATRLRCYRRGMLGLMFGLVGALATRASQGTLAVDLELAAIVGLARGKVGLNRKILDVTMADGAHHRFAIDRYDDVTARLRAAVAAAGVRLVDLGGDRWQADATA